MNEVEFLRKWDSEREMYIAWGSFVATQISDALQVADQTLDLKKFLKIPPTPRVKEADSLLGKAFHRNKPYKNPYEEIEDKIGVRFVVLLTSDIKNIARVIENSKLWHASLDKDYEAERDNRPLEFTYQSMHYVLKAADDLTIENGIAIPRGTPCEVQLRTLLQHAHSELTHDSIYKREPGAEVSRPAALTS
jgi:putative GTP pyrophosphokinase